MALFDVILASGVTLHDWSTGEPRANPMPGRPQYGYLGTVGVEIEAHIFDGVEAPADPVEPDGPYFYQSDIGEWPMTMGPPVITSETGYQSIQRFTPTEPGHYLWVFRKWLYGALAVHIEVMNA
jgi:hypothetical protein